jgi:hypothetical protein
MNTAGAHELGYASVAIIGALFDRLVTSNVISGADANAILDDATATLKGLGNIASAPGAIGIVDDVRAQLARLLRRGTPPVY